MYAEKIDIEAQHIQFESRSMTALIGYQPNPRWNFFNRIKPGKTLEGYLGGIRTTICCA